MMNIFNKHMYLVLAIALSSSLWGMERRPFILPPVQDSSETTKVHVFSFPPVQTSVQYFSGILVKQPLVFDRRGRAIISTDDKIRIWHSKTGNIEEIFPNIGTRIVNGSLSPDGKTMVVVTVDEEAYILDTDGKEISHLSNDLGAVTSACFSPDGEKLALITRREFLVITAETGKVIFSLGVGAHNFEAGGIQSIHFGPDSNKIILLEEKNDQYSARIIMIDGGEPVDCIPMVYGVNATSFSSDGTKLVYGHQSYVMASNIHNSDNVIVKNYITVKDGLKGTWIASWEVPENYIKSVSFNADGSSMTTHGQAVQVWNTANKKSGPIIKCTTNDGRVFAGFSPHSHNGNQEIVFIGQDERDINSNSIETWLLPPDMTLRSRVVESFLEEYLSTEGLKTYDGFIQYLSAVSPADADFINGCIGLKLETYLRAFFANQLK